MKLDNQQKNKTDIQLILLCCILAGAALPVAGAESKKPSTKKTPAPATVISPAPPPAPRSIFIQPNSPKDGRDPFFPLSTRPYASAVIPAAKTDDLSSLAIRGKSGTLDRPLVIINDVTFAVGDDRDVITPDGRIHIHCLEIVGDLAVIEANGQRHKLRFETKP